MAKIIPELILRNAIDHHEVKWIVPKGTAIKNIESGIIEYKGVIAPSVIRYLKEEEEKPNSIKFITDEE